MRGYCNCNNFCRQPSFPIALLHNAKGKWYKRNPERYSLITKKYTRKHREQGLARCKQCEYVTAEPARPGTICPCCKYHLSIRMRDPRKESTIIVSESESEPIIIVTPEST